MKTDLGRAGISKNVTNRTFLLYIDLISQIECAVDFIDLRSCLWLIQTSKTAEFRSAHKAPMQCEVSAPSPNEDVKKYFTNLTHWILNYTTDCTKAHKAMMMMIKTRGFALKRLENMMIKRNKIMKVWISLHKNLSWNGPFLWKSWACISYYLALISTYI